VSRVTAVITQPTYLPWIGYFEQIARADVFVFLDTVQFVARSWHSRNRLKGTDGEPFWLSIPVAAHRRTARLMDIRISENQQRWRTKHLRSIRTHLGSAPYFKSLYPKVEEWISAEYEYLVDLNIAGIKMLSALLHLSPAFGRASELNVGGERTQLLVNLCKQLGANRYYSSAGSRAYMHAETHLFAEAGVEVVYQMWQHPIYPQHGTHFVSHLSVIDALMNIGPQATRSLIKDGGEVVVENATY
jgi:WbqC-like protein family